MSAFTSMFRPKPGNFGQNLTVESTALGTGGTSVSNTATTSVCIATPMRKCQLVGLAINGLVAGASTSALTIQGFKRDNSIASPADVTLTATKSIKSDVISTLQKAYTVAITGTDAQTIFQAGDILRIDVVAAGTVSTQPTVNVVATFAMMN